MRAVRLARVVDGDDVRVRQPGERLDFPPEPLDRLRGLDEGIGQQLDGDLRFILRWIALNTRPMPPPPSSSSSAYSPRVPCRSFSSAVRTAASPMVSSATLVRPAVEPVAALQHPRPLPQPFRQVRGIPAQILHAGLLPLLAQLLPAVEEVPELVGVGGHGRSSGSGSPRRAFWSR